MELGKEIATLWLNRRDMAIKYRQRAYDPLVHTIQRYYHTNKAILFPDAGESMHNRPFATPNNFHEISVALVGQFVRIMLPYVFFKVPNRTVAPRNFGQLQQLQAMVYGVPQIMASPAMQKAQIQSAIGGFLLNLAADDGMFNLRGETRRATQEALISGRGILWTELVTTPYGTFPGSFYESQENVVIDPDHDSVRDANYIMRRRERPSWEVAEEFKLPIEKVRGKGKSWEQRASDKSGTGARYQEDENDICEYWEVYSKMGLGHRIVEDDDLRKRFELASEKCGDNVYLAVMDGVEFPLNMDPEKAATKSEAELIQDLQWPIQLHGDFNNPWPFSRLDFYEDGIYPKPPLEDALPLQQFLDFAYYYMMDSIKASSRNMLLVDETVGKELEKALESGKNWQIVKLKIAAPDISKMVEHLHFDGNFTELFQVISAVKREWEESTGMNTLLQGASPEKMFRSSAEAQIRQSNSQIRPDDLRDCVLAFQGEAARKEHAAQRLTMRADVAVYLGEDTASQVKGPLTMAWLQNLATDDPWTAAQEEDV